VKKLELEKARNGYIVIDERGNIVQKNREK